MIVYGFPGDEECSKYIWDLKLNIIYLSGLITKLPVFNMISKTKSLFIESKIFNMLIRSSSTKSQSSGLVLGVYNSADGSGQDFAEAGDRLNEQTNGYLKELLKKDPIPFGKAKVYSGLGIQSYNHIAFASVGPRNPNKLNLTEQLNEEKENIRVAMAVGARTVQDQGANQIFIDGVSNPEAAAEGSILGVYKYKANQTAGDRQNPHVELYDHLDTNSWASGEINASAQNWARFLSHAPSNYKKAAILAEEIIDKLCRYDIRVDVRNRDWMAMRKMSATLSLIKGMCESPIMLEISYCGDDPAVRPIVLVGKGSIFDSGGLFLKSYKGLYNFRADMAGAAAIVGAMQGVARKRLPLNVTAVILLYENMPSPMGLKPGDVVRDKHGRHIRIGNPDNDCRVVLSDVVSFTDYYSPSLIIDVGTFTNSIAECLGLAATGAFTVSTALWNELQRAGLESGDRVWRMPLWNHFRKINAAHRSVDLDNNSSPTGGDTCLAAAFLQEFVPLDQECCCPTKIPFIHLDCFGTGLKSQTGDEAEPYYRKGIKMGRPTRTLIQFLYHRACLLPKAKPKKSKQ